MKKIFILVFVFLSFITLSEAQRYAVSSGNWTSSIWATTPGGIPGTAATPGANDDVYTNGRIVTIASPVSCRNLHISFDVAGSLVISGTNKLTINGTLTGYNDLGLVPADPITTIFTMSTSASIDFIGSNVALYNPYVIRNWNLNNPFDGRLTFIYSNASRTRNILGNVQFNNYTRVRRGNTIAEGQFNSNDASLLDINSLASLRLNAQADSWLAVIAAGDMTNEGVFNVGDFDATGSASKSISGSGVLNVINLSVSNSAGFSNNSNINLTGELTLSASGVFNANGGGSGTLTLVSNSLLGGGSIAALPTPSNFTGNITVQRFVDGPADWRYFSVPITNANVSMWQATMPIGGNFSNPDSGAVGCIPCSSIYTYDATSQAYAAVGTGASTSSTTLSHQTGYSAYTWNPGNFTLSVTGDPVKGNVSIPLSSNGDGWNLIPNPYPSPIDWDNVTPTGTTNTVYMTTDQGSFATYLQGDNNCTGCAFDPNWRGEIAAGQSFWIASTGASSLLLTESAKTSNATFAKLAPKPIASTKPANTFVRVELQSLSQNQKDDIIINFDDNATPDLEYTYDAQKFRNTNYINLSCYNHDSTLDYVINSIPYVSPLNGSSIVKLRLNNTPQGTYALNFKELQDFSLNYEIYLIDNFNSTRTKIQKSGVFGSMYDYKFTVNQNPHSSGDSRFEVEFRRVRGKKEAFGHNFKIYPNPTTSELNVFLDAEELDLVEQITLSDFNGKVYLEVGRKNLNIENDFDISHLKKGIYVLKILGQDNEKNFKLYKQ